MFLKWVLEREEKRGRKREKHWSADSYTPVPGDSGHTAIFQCTGQCQTK